MKTIAEQLNVKEFPLKIFDKKENRIYIEWKDKSWIKKEFNKDGKLIYYENSLEFWYKNEFNNEGNIVYFEDSYGKIIDRRVKELTLEEIAEKFGIEVNQLKIKK